MSECKIRARVGDKSIEKNVCRPDFEEVLKPYVEITNIAKNNFFEPNTIFRNRDVAVAEAVFGKIGGKLEEARIEAEEKCKNDETVARYIDTCATRVCYALNKSPMPITFEKVAKTTGTKWTGADKYFYYTGVYGLKSFLDTNWKELDYKKSTENMYGNIKAQIQQGKPKDFFHFMGTQAENEDFFDKISTLKHKKKGIILLFGDVRHATLWNGYNFVDVAIGYGNNYLKDTTQLIKEVYFWEII